MIISRIPVQDVQIHINGKNKEQVNKFKYLRCLVNDKWDPDVEIKTRAEQATATSFVIKTLTYNLGTGWLRAMFGPFCCTVLKRGH